MHYYIMCSSEKSAVSVRNSADDETDCDRSRIRAHLQHARAGRLSKLRRNKMKNGRKTKEKKRKKSRNQRRDAE